MLIDIDKIVVGERIRKDFGDIQELADDIKENTLLNALVVTPNGEGTYLLIAGERRLRACKSLGYKAVTVNVVAAEDAEQALRMEISENECRKDFSMTERLAYAEKLQTIKAAEAKQRMVAAHTVGTPNSAELGETRDVVAKAIGMGHETFRQARIIADNADLLDPAEFADWDEGRLSTNKAYQRIKAAQKKAEQERDAARRELDAAQQDLADAWQAQEDAETEVVVLKRKLESIEKPKPEVREVVREVKPKDYDSLRQDNERLNREYQEMWRKKQELDRQLEQANELLGEKGRTDSAQRDIEALTSATNAYLRQYGGKVWAFDQFDRVDKATQEEFEKAITSMAAFAQNMAQMIRDRK